MKILILIIVCLGAVLAYDIVHVFILSKKSATLIRNTTPFTRVVTEPKMKILVLGDSTAYGTGVTDSALSTAGRLGTLYPDAEVKNLAVNGLKIEGLLEILNTLSTDERFEIILVQIGANDIIRLTPIDSIRTGIQDVLAKTQKIGTQVIVLHSGNIGETYFFPWYVRPVLSRRSLEVREIYKKESDRYEASYVDLIDSPVDKLVKENPDIYYAEDLLHLSNDGYGMWFEEIKKHLQPVSKNI